MNIGKPNTTSEWRFLIGMVHYYQQIGKKRLHMLDPLKETDRDAKGKGIVWNNETETFLKETNKIVSSKGLLNYPYYIIMFILYTDTADKQLVGVIVINNKPTSLLLERLSKLQRNYNNIDK